MKATIYANYGVLAHEKQIIYSDLVPIGDIYDKITVEIPDSLNPYVTSTDRVCIRPSDSKYSYTLTEVLTCMTGRKPAVRYSNGESLRIVALPVIEEVEA